MNVEQLTHVPPKIDALGFANVLDKNSVFLQVQDLQKLFATVQEQVQSDDVAVFACEIHEDTVRVLQRMGYGGQMYVQHPTNRIGQVLLSNIDKEAITVKHTELALNAWKMWRSGPPALTTANVLFGGEIQTIGGTHLTHLSGNMISKLFEVKQLTEKMDQEQVSVLAADLNRGQPFINGVHLCDPKLDYYFQDKHWLSLIREIVRRVEPRFVGKAWGALFDAGYEVSEYTRDSVTWVPDAKNDEGWLDVLSAKHEVGVTTDHVFAKDVARVAVRVLSDRKFHTDHIPFIATPR